MRLSEVPFPKGKKSFKISKAKEKVLKEAFSSMPKSFTANFVYLTKDGKLIKFASQACHVQNSVKRKNLAAIITECGWARSNRKSPKDGIEVYRGFANWLVKESFFSRFISNRDDPIDDILNDGVIVSAEVPQPIFHAICMISRHFYECTSFAFKTFDEFVAKGMSKEMAYNLCFNSSISKAEVTRTSYPVSCQGAGHRAWRLLDLNNMRKMLEVGPVLPDDWQPYSSFQSTSGVVSLFPQVASAVPLLFQDLFKEEAFKKALSKYRKEKTSGEAYTPPNPFARTVKPRVKPTDITIEEIREVVVPYLISIGF